MEEGEAGLSSLAVSGLRCGLLLLVLAASGCAVTPPRNPDDICAIFNEKEDWYDDAKAMNERWGVPIHVPMAMMYQESSFRHDAEPPRYYFLGIIPWGRISDAYGYSQAKTAAWSDYQRETGNSGADRDDFGDALDFMGWYITKTHKINRISKWDARAQYLNYHEGWTGYRRRTYAGKRWLQDVATVVGRRADRYAAQLRRCRDDLEDRGWFF